ncbi:MAG: glutamine synthetase III [Clostridiales bacterium]|jgi:glutamine synthetase|nr:glutamine synthetase III [Clostridiales bacterium]
MENIVEIFGSMVFNESVMRERLPREVFHAVKRTIELGAPMERAVADVVANAMKEWAVGLGATHFTHWFGPMTGITAEKHDSFVTPAGDGRVIMAFSGKSLVRGESDASSFPSGGLRCTFEARGYTIWDATSYAFIKDKTLYIPTAFCSYGGEALDKKTPLLRSMQALNKQALRILRLFGNDARSVVPMAGPEQEYFLIDKEVYLRRPDLISCGRTLFGARPPKGQELNDHYFGSLKPRVAAFMQDLDLELWKLGVSAATKHKEAAPSQYELVIHYTTTNIACDHNQITMDLMKSIAARHGLVCLLHEKPFSGVNGSGKHNNWSLATDKGENLLKPGKTPRENVQFLLFLTATIAAVDIYQDLIRVSAASAGNDHRLGGHEAPPAIVSVYLGEELTEILEGASASAPRTALQVGVATLPQFPKDSTDRNRTSPFAFTGNKFEFRMLGSSFSLSGFNTVLNTAVAEMLSNFADELEVRSQRSDLAFVAEELIRKTFAAHRRIIFSGNNYSPEWEQEAESRGLSNLRDTPAALGNYLSEQNVELFEKYGVFTRAELQARHEILLERYYKTLQIEGYTMAEIVRKSILPAVLAYQNHLATLIAKKQNLALDLNCSPETQLLRQISDDCAMLAHRLNTLEECLGEAKAGLRDAMERLREIVDRLEQVCSVEVWPMPCYGELLHSV